MPPLKWFLTPHRCSHTSSQDTELMAGKQETTSEIGDVRTPRRGDDNAMVRSFGNARVRMEQELLEEANGDLELLALLHDQAKQFKEQKDSAKNKGLTMAEYAESRREERKRKAQHDPDDDEEGEDSSAEESSIVEMPSLRRGQFLFATWSKKLIDVCFAHVDKKRMTKQVLKALKHSSKLECMELGFDIRVFGDLQDRVGCVEVPKLMEAMKRVYMSLGERFQNLSVDMASGTIVWGSCGPYYVQLEDDDEVLVGVRHWACSKTEDMKVKVSKSDHLLDDKGPFDVVMPFSLRQAALRSRSTSETFTIATLIPEIRRNLKKNPSETEGAVALMKKSALESKQAAAAKRKKTKAVGVRQLGAGATAAEEEGTDPGVSVAEAGSERARAEAAAKASADLEAARAEAEAAARAEAEAAAKASADLEAAPKAAGAEASPAKSAGAKPAGKAAGAKIAPAKAAEADKGKDKGKGKNKGKGKTAEDSEPDDPEG